MASHCVRSIWPLAILLLSSLATSQQHGQSEQQKSPSRPSEQVQVVPPPLHRASPPKPDAAAEELEKQGDELRGTKYYLDAIDYYNAASRTRPNDAVLSNKLGITELLLQRYKPAQKHFERAIKGNRQYADAYNNLGVIFYIDKKYGKAIKEYERAINLNDQFASYFSNLGAAYFAKRDFEKAASAYAHAIQLDPEVFERVSHSGVSAQMSKPEDRAHYDYVVAKLYAQVGATDRSLQYLRRAMEEGYKDINNVYKDAEFADLRKDPRFTALMAAKPPAIPE